ncbi:hypothetical protein D3C81_2250910 [compost metagenome]
MTQKMPPAATSIAMLCVPVIGLIVSSVVFHERISADLALGLALVAASVAASALAARFKRSLVLRAS